MKPSTYNVIFKLSNDTALIFNTRTGALIYVEEFSGISNVNSNEELLALSAGGFVVEENFDELSEIKDRFSRAQENEKSLSLTILAAEACNMKCPYCFIHEQRELVISSETLHGIYNYIEKRKDKLDRIWISWFGGEPMLVHSKIISFMKRISDLLKNQDIELNSNIVTNGVLLTKSRFNEYLANGISEFQVTLDGDQGTHDMYRSLKTGEGTFSNIWKNLKEIKNIQKNYSFLIRGNFTRKTISGMESLAAKFTSSFGNDKRFSIYFRPVYNFSTVDDRIDILANDVLGFEEGVFEQNRLGNLSGNNFTHRYLSDGHLPRPLYTWCNTEQKNSFIVGADGKLFKCDNYIGNGDESVGVLFKDGTISLNSRYDEWISSSIYNTDEERCIGCEFLPICQGGCPRSRYEDKTECFWTKAVLFDAIKHHVSNSN